MVMQDNNIVTQKHVSVLAEYDLNVHTVHTYLPQSTKLNKDILANSHKPYKTARKDKAGQKNLVIRRWGKIDY